MSHASHPAPFFIRRHAVQQLLRQALDAGDTPIRGLLGGREQRVEVVHAVTPDTAPKSIHATVKDWHARGLHLLGAYSSGETARQMAATGLIPGGDTATLPQLVIRTDTRGRIEATLFACDETGTAHACNLEMQEDGGLYPLQDKG